MTERIYYLDSYKFEGDGKVISLSASAQDNTKLDLVLDRTIMHPQGGGQPSDTGVIQFPDITGSDGKPLEYNVVDVRSDRETNIIHHYGHFTNSVSTSPDSSTTTTTTTTTTTSLPVTSGVKASILIDTKKRQMNARLHSAGHLLDAALRNLGYTQLQPTKGYHFSDGPNVEYIGELDQATRDSLPAALNQELSRLIAEDGNVVVGYEENPSASSSSSSKEHTLDNSNSSNGSSDKSLLDSSTSPTALRIVNVGGLACPCGGTHVKKLSDITGVQVSKIKKVKNTIKVYYNITEN